jgi:glycosyltransferase involved in cell wall biosynthesis
MHHNAPVPSSRVDLTIFIACYNEEGDILASLDSTIAALDATLLSWEIIVIDDASTDRSVPLIQEFARRHPQYPIRLIQNPVNKGLSHNFVEGAFLGRGEHYRLVCGDHSEAEPTLTELFRHVGAAELVIPYHEIVGRPMFRRIVSTTFTMLVNWLSGYRLRYYNGCAIYRRAHVMRWHSRCRGFGFQADLVTRLLDERIPYIEISLTSYERSAGRSKALTLKNFLSVAHFFLDLAIRRAGKLVYGKERRSAVPAAPIAGVRPIPERRRDRSWAA